MILWGAYKAEITTNWLLANRCRAFEETACTMNNLI